MENGKLESTTRENKKVVPVVKGTENYHGIIILISYTYTVS